MNFFGKVKYKTKIKNKLFLLNLILCQPSNTKQHLLAKQHFFFEAYKYVIKKTNLLNN